MLILQGMLFKIIISHQFLYFFKSSEAPPDRDESDVGSRDSALKSTYEGLVNIRYVLSYMFFYILYLLCFVM
jgi:hypothetical protein